jgi:triacylglycerol lipase
MSNGTIVLAHGLFGFGNLLASLPSVVNYFNGVAAHLRRQGHTVIAPQVNPIGAINQRGDQLASAILSQTGAGDRVHIIAHSMGGLDARYAITHRNDVVQRIATLVTIGTPHRGSPVADAVANQGDPLFAHIPSFLVRQLETNAGALHDLTTDVCTHFDDSTPDVDGVRYIEVAGDASKGGHELFLFQLAAVIGKITGEVNDGVVTKRSALRKGEGHKHLDDWPVDHAGEVGWSLDSPAPVEVELPLVPTPPHFARYDSIVELLE